jgi:hypothetical protein
MPKRTRRRESAKRSEKNSSEFGFASSFAASRLRGLFIGRAGGIRWSPLVFLALFSAFVMVIAHYTIIPGMEAARQASPQEKRTLVAWYRLLLAVLLFILFAGIVLTFRFGRLFFPRPSAPRSKTQYVDAWAESARRLDVPPDDGSDKPT